MLLDRLLLLYKDVPASSGRTYDSIFLKLSVTYLHFVLKYIVLNLNKPYHSVIRMLLYEEICKP